MERCPLCGLGGEEAVKKGVNEVTAELSDICGILRAATSELSDTSKVQAGNILDLERRVARIERSVLLVDLPEEPS